MSLYNGPARGGNRGGKDQFDWENVKADKDREYYLGHSVKATTGRWQKGAYGSLAQWTLTLLLCVCLVYGKSLLSEPHRWCMFIAARELSPTYVLGGRQRCILVYERKGRRCRPCSSRATNRQRARRRIDA